MKKVLIIGFACVMALNMWAERVSVEDAAVVANNFMNVAQPASGVHRAPAKRMVLKANSESSEPQYYIYENANGEGWVMVAANDVVRPILAYSHTGSFRTDNMPKNVKGWLGRYSRQIKQAEENNVQATEEVGREWRRLRRGLSPRNATPVVSPLIQTKWDQDDPYWNLCPMSGSNHTLVGCVATAMAQVMYYWKWPKQGTGSHSYSTESLDLSCSADFANTTYDWDNMLLIYNGYFPEGSSNWTTSGVPTPTTAQKNAIATLMYHCGVAVAMDYNIASAGGSGAYTIRPNASLTTAKCALNALYQNFGYNSSTIKGYNREGGYGYSQVSDADWHNYLKTELDAARPVMYAGADDEGGHSFICDGYDNTTPTRKYHFNFGWSGYCDGYYDVDNLVPGIGGSGAGNGSYNDSQDIIIGIQPPETGHEVVKNATGCTISCTNYAKNGEDFAATITPTDETYDFTSLTVQLGSATLTLNTDYTLSANHQTLTINASAISGDENNDLTITAVWTKSRYLYALLGENCTPDDLSGTLAMSGVALELTILPDEGYTLADASCWDVEMGDETLVYGTDFTYDASTGAFSIASVTGDVLIFVYGGKSVTWRANGNVFATNMAIEDKISLPVTEPAACEGKEFVGWTATENYESATVAPTFAEDGDTYSVATYYAVYATPGEGGIATWNLVTNAATLKAGDVLVIANAANEVTAGALSSQILGAVSSTFSNSQISSLGVGTLEFTLGGTSGAWTLSTADGSLGATAVKKLAWGSGTTTWSISISDGDATIQNGTDSYGRFLYNKTNPRFTTYTSDVTAAMLLPQLYRKSNGGSSYSDYTTTCTTPEPPEPVYYTIRFFDKGVQVGETQSVLKNSQPEVPSDPEACDGYTFVGWWGATLPEDNTTAHTWTTDFTATRDTTYYAIFSHTETEGGENSKIIQLDATEDTTFPKEGITLSVSNGVLNNGTDYRVYKGSTLTITSTVGDMSNIALTYDGSYNGGGWASSYQPNAATWTSPTTTSGNSGKQARITFIEITVGTAPTSTTYYSSVACGSTTDIEETAVVPSAQKLLRNGQIVIIRGEAVYTITGERIQ